MTSRPNQAKIFIINLDRSPGRWQYMSNQLDKFGLPYERVPAVDGAILKDYAQSFCIRKFKLLTKHDLVPGEAGCSYSHMVIWQRMLTESLPYAIILEDDGKLDQEFLKLYQNSAYQDFDYLKFDIDPSTYPYPFKTFKKNKKNGLTSIECDPIPYGTGGYAISKKGARIFLDATRKMYYPIDILPQFTFPYTKQGIMSKQLIRNDVGDSLILNRDFSEQGRPDKIKVFFIKITGRFMLRKLSVLYRLSTLKLQALNPLDRKIN